MEDNLAINPRPLVEAAQEKPQCHEQPEAARQPGSGESVRQHDGSAAEHQEQHKNVRECREGSSGMAGHRHDDVNQGNPGRGDNPTVAAKQIHPLQF